MRDAWLKHKMQRFIKRRTVPKGLANDADAQTDEIVALFNAIRARAPLHGYEEWWARFEREIAEIMETRAWPTEYEIKRAALAVPRDRAVGKSGGEWELDPERVAADRINAGEAVGDEYLFGMGCAKMLKRGLVHESALAPYRRALTENIRQMYSEGEAQTFLGDLHSRHEDAKRALGLGNA